MDKASMYTEYYTAQQELEEKYGQQSVVLMMVGSFYEIYGVDLPNEAPPVRIGNVEEAHSILGMNMSLKNKSLVHSAKNPYFVGFPDYAIDEHLGKFLRANMTVSIYDQYDVSYTNSKGETKNKKGRQQTKIFTPSTYVDDTLSDSNALLAFEITEYKSVISKQVLKKIHVAVISLSTGKSYLLEAYDTSTDVGKAEAELYRIIHTYSPREIIYCGKPDKKFSKIYDLGNTKVYFREIPKQYHKPSYQNEFLKNVYSQDALLSPIEFLGLEKHTSVIPHFIQALQFAYEQDKFIASRIQKPIFVESKEQLILNNDSIYQLNLVASPFEVSNTLYDIVCKTRTAMGKRCLRERLLTPTMNINILEERYSLVEKMKSSYKDYDGYLRGVADIEKKYRKMVLKTLHPYELADLRGTWSTIRKLLSFAKDSFQISEKVIDDFDCFYNEYIGNFDFSIMKTCKLNDIKGSFFIEGVNEELDAMEYSILEGKKVLIDLAKELSSMIDSDKDCVKLDSTDKEGWYLTTTKTRFKKLKEFKTMITYHGKKYTVDTDSFELVTLKNTVKIRSPVIRRISADIIKQRNRMNEKIKEEYIKVLEHYVVDYGELFIKLADLVGHVDFIYSAGKVAAEFGYTRPVIKNIQNDHSYIKAIGIRHPIVEQINDSEEYTTNDISIGIDQHYGSIVYGLNMSGKSTLLKALGCNVVLAQTGMFVSSEQFTFYPFNCLLSKMSIRDNMSKGQSTFMVEMLEVKNMLMRADPNVLVLSDELCSSTESTSAHAIVAETLHALTEKKAKFLFSTHLHDLQKIDIVTNNPHIKIYHFKVHFENNSIIFDRHIEEGGMTDLYGLEVARALGLPESFMRGAFAVRDQLTEQPTEILSTKQSRYCSEKYVHKCVQCGSTKDLHTHHHRHQQESDENGLIDGKFHKNRKFNLEILCKECHAKEHNV